MNDLPELPTYLFQPSLAGILSLVLTFVLPLLAGLLMKQSWGTGLKGTILLFMSAVKSFLEAWLASVSDHVFFNFWGVFYATILNFLVAVAMYYGLLKKTAIQQAAINSGVKD